MAISQLSICNYALNMLGAIPLTSAQLTNESTDAAVKCASFWDFTLNEVLEDFQYAFTIKTVKLNFTSGFGYYADTDEKTVTGITKADPAVVSSTAHGFLNGHTVELTDIGGMTELNDAVYEVANVAANTFELLDINSSSMTTYTSGGKAIRKEVDSKYSNGYTYDLPTDFLIAMQLEDENAEFEVTGVANNERILTTVEDAVLKYVSLDDTPSQFKTRFANAVGHNMARKLAVPLGKKGTSYAWIDAVYDKIVGKGRVAESKNKKKARQDKDTWLEAGNFTV